MIIGLDFDNTIVSYDSLFHKIALEKGLISENIPINKIAVRDYLRKIGKEDQWTEMQGYVYGARLDEAVSFPGVCLFLRWAQDEGHTVYIVSHKTRYPFRGPKYDLHHSAKLWIRNRLQDACGEVFNHENAFFMPTKEDKIHKILDLNCDVFLDDLPEILFANNFPSQTNRFLFDPESHYTGGVYSSLKVIENWEEFKNHLTF